MDTAGYRPTALLPLQLAAILIALACVTPAAAANSPATPQITTVSESPGHAPAPLVIRSVRQDLDQRMLGDRSPEQVQAALGANTAAPTSGPRLCPWPLTCATPAPPARARLRLDAYAAEIDAASTQWGVDPMLVRAVVHAESAFNPSAVSPKGAQGLMQLMPGTAARFGVTDPFDPKQNVDAGVRYLAWLLERFAGDARLATAAYNAGEGAVDRHGGVPPYAETEAYVVKVEALTHAYRQAAQSQIASRTAPSVTDPGARRPPNDLSS